MPKDIKGSPIDIMKAISMFDIEKDFTDIQAREKLGILLHNLIMIDDANAKKAKQEIGKLVHNLVIGNTSKIKKSIADFINKSSDIIGDIQSMAKEKPEDTGDEVDFPADEESYPEDNESSDTESSDTGEEDKEPTDDVVPDEVLAASFNPLISRANSFLYI